MPLKDKYVEYFCPNSVRIYKNIRLFIAHGIRPNIQFCFRCSIAAVKILAARAAAEKNVVALAATKVCVVPCSARVEPKRQAARIKNVAQVVKLGFKMLTQDEVHLSAIRSRRKNQNKKFP